jgi:glyoxylase-like metal-dependent hydrolase (beta-lactamase superfamily II)
MLGNQLVLRTARYPIKMLDEPPETEVEVRDLANGLWIWRLRHPHWKPGLDWQPIVTSVCVDLSDHVLLLDPLLPPFKARDFWMRLAKREPTTAVVLKPDHVRDVDLVIRLFGVRAFGPSLFWPDDIPKERLEPLEANDELPGGLLALYDGRGKNETPLWLPQHRTLVFADALTERAGQLRIWNSRAHRERALPALRSLLDLPFERVIISHGDPVHGRRAFEDALELPPWPGE